MSYEGYSEHLCENGHISNFNQYFTPIEGTLCNICNGIFVFVHHVDETNGVEFDQEGNPYLNTIPYPFQEIGFDNDWKEDHYGNKYAIKILRYKIPKKEGEEE